MKKLHFISGLPRSGSTVLVNILRQNPRFWASDTSGVPELITSIKDGWNNVAEFKATPNDTAKENVLRGIFENFYKDVDKDVVFDKSRTWPKYISTLENLFKGEVKIIATVRDMRDILSSWEKLYRKTTETGVWFPEEKNPLDHQTVKSRCEFALKNTQPIGSSYNFIMNAVQRGYLSRFLWVDYDDLTREPEVTMKRLYEFIGEPYYDHDFKNIEQVAKEDDSIYGIKDLHKIRKELAPLASDWEQVLGKDADIYKRYNFWKQ